MGKTKKIKKVSWKTEEERKMILNQVMREINKKSDSDVIHYAKEEKDREKMPGGIPEIDSMLGGGFPCGLFSCVWGGEQSGKCVDKNTLIVTDKGLQKIGELPYKKEGYTKFKQSLITPIGKIETSHLFKQTINKYIEIVLTNGLKLKATENHPVYTKRGFVSLSQLKKEDEIILVGGLINLVNPSIPKINFNPIYSKSVSYKNRFYDFPKQITKELAFALGYHLGDGNHNDKNFVISFGDKQKMNSFIGKLKLIFGNLLKCNFHRNKNNYIFYTQKVIRQFFEYLGSNINPIENLEIPNIIFISPKEIIGSFIYGLLSADGGVDKKGRISITLISEKIITQLQQLLLYTGIRSNIRIKYNKKYNKNYLTLVIAERKELNKLGFLMFGSNRRLSSKKGFASKFQRCLTNLKSEHFDKLDCFLFWEKISSIKKINNKMEVFDVSVPKYNIFIGNSIINHNTSIAHCLTAKAQELGKQVYYIAQEEFDKPRAQTFGVNLEKLLIGQFPTAEQALDSIIEFARKKLVDVILLDSIHALSPRGEMEEKSGAEKSTEKDTIALRARKLSQFFRMSIDAVKKANIPVILIAQTRMDIGFFAFETMATGRALKFFCKIILHIKRGSKSDAPVRKEKRIIIDGEGYEHKKTVTIPIGFDTTIEIDKAQVSGTKPEQTKIHLPYYFATGFSKKLEVIKLGEKKSSGRRLLSKSKGDGSSPSSLATDSKNKRKRGRPRKNEKTKKVI